MNTKITLSSTIGALHIIAGDVKEAEKVGASPVEFKLASQAKPWTGGDRARVTQTLEKYVFGGMDAQGLGRIQVPAEMVAAAIFVTVHPNNVRRACAFFEGYRSAEAEMAGTMDTVSAGKLVAIITMMYGEAHAECVPLRDTFLKAIEKRINAGDVVV